MLVLVSVVGGPPALANMIKCQYLGLKQLQFIFWWLIYALPIIVLLGYTLGLDPEFSCWASDQELLLICLSKGNQKATERQPVRLCWFIATNINLVTVLCKFLFAPSLLL